MSGPVEQVAQAPTAAEPTAVAQVALVAPTRPGLQVDATAEPTDSPGPLAEATSPLPTPPTLTVALVSGGPASGQAGGAPAVVPSPTTVLASTPTVAATPSMDEAQPGHPYVSHRVQSGDTMEAIAGRYGVSPRSIAQASGVTNPSALRVGQILTVPREPGWLYRVQAGETLDQIGGRRGIPASAIQTASLLPSASVQAGDLILIPDAGERFVVKK